MRQRWTAWRHGLLALAAVAIVATPVYASEKSASDGTSTKPPKLVRTALYTYALLTGRVTIEFARMKIVTLGYGHSRNEFSWSTFECKITPAEAKYLRRLVEDADLRNFQPKGAWFDRYDVEKFGLREGGANLVVTWNDKEVVLAIPPREVCSRVPKAAKRVYKLIGSMTRRMEDMEEKCARTACITAIEDPWNSPEIDRLHEEMDSISKRTLPKPKDQEGW